MKHLLCSLILLLILPLTLQAQQWERIGLPGGSIKRFSYDSSVQRMYYALNTGVLYFSNDLGKTATRVYTASDSLPMTESRLYAEHGFLYVADDDPAHHFHRTSDNGLTWTPIVVDSALEHQPFPRFANEREMFTAAYRSRIMDSHGRRFCHPQQHQVCIGHEVHQTTGYMVIVDETAQHPYRTTDNGSTWAVADSGLPPGGAAIRIFTTTVDSLVFLTGNF